MGYLDMIFARGNDMGYKWGLEGVDFMETSMNG